MITFHVQGIVLDFPLIRDCSTTQRPISNEYELYDHPFSTFLSIFIKAFFTGLGFMFSNEDGQYRYGNVIDLLVTPRRRPSFIDTQNMAIKGPGGRIIPTDVIFSLSWIPLLKLFSYLLLSVNRFSGRFFKIITICAIVGQFH